MLVTFPNSGTMLTSINVNAWCSFFTRPEPIDMQSDASFSVLDSHGLTRTSMASCHRPSYFPQKTGVTCSGPALGKDVDEVLDLAPLVLGLHPDPHYSLTSQDPVAAYAELNSLVRLIA